MALKRPPRDRNLLDLKPVRLMEHTEAEGRVSVLILRFRSRWLGFLQRRLRKPCLQLHLDEVGSAVWLACDGQRSVGQIGQVLQDRFGPQVDPIWDRLGLFVRHLQRGQLIDLRN